MKTFKGYGNFWKIYGMSNFQLRVLLLGLRFIVFMRRFRPSPRYAHYVGRPAQSIIFPERRKYIINFLRYRVLLWVSVDKDTHPLI